MSNINKQAREKLKLTAAKAVDNFDPNMFVETRDVLALLDELEAAEKRLSEILKPNILLPVIDGMDEYQLRRVIKNCTENYSLLHSKWEAAEKRIAELEDRTITVRLTDINEFLAEVHDKTLNLAFRRLAEGVREADIYAMRAAGIITKVGE